MIQFRVVSDNKPVVPVLEASIDTTEGRGLNIRINGVLIAWIRETDGVMFIQYLSNTDKDNLKGLSFNGQQLSVR